MRLRVVLFLATVAFAGESASAQKHEFAFTSGGLKIGERGFDLPQPGFIRFGTGFTYELGPLGAFSMRNLNGLVLAIHVLCVL